MNKTYKNKLFLLFNPYSHLQALNNTLQNILSNTNL